MSISAKMKIVVAGPGLVGKTASCLALRGKGVPSELRPTLGADFFIYRTSINGVELSLQIWDLAGQQAYGKLRKMYYRGLGALILMVDLTSLQSFELGRQYLHKEIKTCLTDEKAHCIAVVGNKRDLVDEIKVSEEQIDKLAEEVNLATGVKTLGFITSAFDPQSVRHAFHSLIKCSLAH